jgi:hypothetical protein
MVFNMLDLFANNNMVTGSMRFFKEGKFFDLSVNFQDYVFEDLYDKETNKLQIHALENDVFLIKFTSLDESRNNKTILIIFKERKAYSGLTKYGGALDFIYV